MVKLNQDQRHFLIQTTSAQIKGQPGLNLSIQLSERSHNMINSEDEAIINIRNMKKLLLYHHF